MIAVFDDVESAVDSALVILEYARNHDIALRFGGAYGEIDMQVNPILGIDAYGQAVDLAARLEPLAEKYELLVDGALGKQLETLGRYKTEPLQLKLLKPVGGLDRHSRLLCFSVQRDETPSPWRPVPANP